jgi:hypothetical protein
MRRGNTFYTQDELADAMDCSTVAMSARMVGSVDWRLSEIRDLDNILDFTADEAVRLIKGERRETPKQKTAPARSNIHKLDRLIKSRAMREGIKTYDFMDAAGIERTRYYSVIGTHYDQGKEEKLTLEELQRIGQTLHIPKEELLEAIWEAIAYETPCPD